MAKTIQELKDSINAVIGENGKGQITGKNLNIVLNDTADTIEQAAKNSSSDKDFGEDFSRTFL